MIDLLSLLQVFPGILMLLLLKPPCGRVRSACVNVSSGFADIDDSAGARLQRAGCASAGVASCGVGRHLTMLSMSIHEVLVARMVSMTCMMHARIHVWVHMLHA